MRIGRIWHFRLELVGFVAFFSLDVLLVGVGLS